MARYYNGWSASPTVRTRPLVVAGVAFVPGIRDNDDVELVLRYFWTQFHDRVEHLVDGWCWGFNYRPNANDPNRISSHGAGVGTDGNAPNHPNGVSVYATFTAAQIREVHAILAEVDRMAEVNGVLAWGGDYNATSSNPHGYDAMHVNADVTPAVLAVAARNIRDYLEANMPLNKDDLAAIRNLVREEIKASTDADKTQTQLVRDRVKTGNEMLKAIGAKVGAKFT